MTKSGVKENTHKGIAQRYANALIELSSKNLSKEDILSQITDIQISLDNSDDLQKVMASPVISINKKKEVLNNLFGKNTNETILNFLNLLVDKGRFNVFDSIVKEYKNIINRLNGLLEIKITSAIELNKNERAMVKVKLEKLLNREMELDWDVNNDIIGGLIFEFGDNIVDCSIQHKLQEIKKEITV